MKGRSEPQLPASFEEAAIMSHARAALNAARGAFVDGDAFDRTTMVAQVRRMLKMLIDLHEINAAYAVRLALAGYEDAHVALSDAIAERAARSEPLGPALATYVNMLADRGPQRFRQPAVRPRENFVANFVIVCLVIDLMREFPGLRLRRNPLSKHLSTFAVVARVLNDEPGLSRGGEEAIRKVWETYGPPRVPGFEAAWPPKK